MKKRTKFSVKSTQVVTGTLLYYGPTPALALKVCIGTVRASDGTVLAVREWRGVDDVRRSPKIANEIVAYLRAQKISAVRGAAGVVDCAHEDRNVCGCDDTIYGADPESTDDDLIVNAMLDADLDVQLCQTAVFVEAQHAMCAPSDEAPVTNVDAFLADLEADSVKRYEVTREQYERMRNENLPTWDALSALVEDGKVGIVRHPDGLVRFRRPSALAEAQHSTPKFIIITTREHAAELVGEEPPAFAVVDDRVGVVGFSKTHGTFTTPAAARAMSEKTGVPISVGAYIATRKEYEESRPKLMAKGLNAPEWEKLTIVEDGKVGIITDPGRGLVRLVEPSLITSGRAAEQPKHAAVTTVKKAVKVMREVTKGSAAEIEAAVRAAAVNGEVGLLFYENRTAITSPEHARRLAA
jgi:hypothetical protein